MYRITDPERSRGFYEALGFEFRREFPIVRDGELEATNYYFFGIPGQEEELELTFNHDRRSYELGSAYGHIAVGVDDLDETLGRRLAEQRIKPEREPYRVREGGSRLCFAKDPDSYRIELIEQSGRDGGDKPATLPATLSNARALGTATSTGNGATAKLFGFGVC
jgi:lactoylglutathione lyase